MTRQLHLGGFQIASQVTHCHAAWRHPGSDTAFTTPEYYHRIGRILERGKFDFVFFADLLAAPARYGGDITEPLRRGTQATATLDPSIVAASIAAVTSKLGVAITKSATYFHPYELARIFASLDHITRGRVAWNIVTSLTQSEAQNFGHDEHLDHEFRYERAEEFVRTALELWSSWDPDALVLDKETGVFADPDRIRRVEHDGKFFKYPRSAQRAPFTAGPPGADPSGVVEHRHATSPRGGPRRSSRSTPPRKAGAPTMTTSSRGPTISAATRMVC